MARRGALGLAAAAVVLAALVAPAAAGQRPHIVELFTSQACSSCPPADALLAQLATRPDVVALGFHITYWNGPGWHDPLSNPAATARQQAYARRFDAGQVYTPEIVVDGDHAMVGSDRGAVLAALAAAPPPARAPVAFAADRRAVTIGRGNGRGAVLLVRFLRRQTTRVAGGENAGRLLSDANGVEALTQLGEWDGAPLRFAVAPPGRDEGIAVLVQAPAGPILGAAATTGAGS
ncbi:MAG TPA: DUF1223 domain-containing protein [Stellaceae bacterium]|nr:DUF1223 domain-containing protein [Stellaceae bacterium]